MKREEAIKNIKKLLGCSDTLDESIFTLFPELKESEDERIRKGIIELVKRTPSSMFDAATELNWIGASHDEIIAWLEKRKEQKPEAKLTGWVARDKEFDSYLGLGLIFFDEKPRRSFDTWSGEIVSQLPWRLFPDLKWEDEPVEVEVTITKK